MTTQSSSDTRSSLLRRAAGNDPVAWHQLVDLYGPLVAHWARRCGCDEHSAADCVQEVLAAVATALPRFESKRKNGSFRAWLWTITRNKMRDANRRQLEDVHLTGGSTAYRNLQQIVDVDSVPDDEPTNANELQELVARGLAQIQVDFSDQSWDAFWRTAVEKVPTSVVAEELGVTMAVVRQARSRITRRLREQLGDF